VAAGRKRILLLAMLVANDMAHEPWPARWSDRVGVDDDINRSQART
jgi:hypothetical protein